MTPNALGSSQDDTSGGMSNAHALHVEILSLHRLDIHMHQNHLKFEPITLQREILQGGEVLSLSIYIYICIPFSLSFYLSLSRSHPSLSLSHLCLISVKSLSLSLSPSLSLCLCLSLSLSPFLSSWESQGVCQPCHRAAFGCGRVT